VPLSSVAPITVTVRGLKNTPMGADIKPMPNGESSRSAIERPNLSVNHRSIPRTTHDAFDRLT
jgi:hypothetical protein